MADTLYRNAQPTLQDLIAQAVAGEGQGAPAPAQAPQAQGSDTSSALLQMLMQPESQGPEPTVDKLSTWDKVRMAIGDSLGSALQTWGSVASGGGPVISDNYGIFLAHQDQQKQDLAEWQRRTAEAKRDAKLKGLMYLDTKDAKLAERKADAAEKKAIFEQTQALKKQEAEQRAAENAAEAAARVAAAEKEMAWKERMASAERRHDESLVRLRAQLDSDSPKSKSAAKQMELLGEAKAGVNKIANNLPKLMQGYTDATGEHPPMDPQSIMTMFRRSVAELNLDKDATEAIQAYFDAEVASQFQRLAGGGATVSW